MSSLHPTTSRSLHARIRESHDRLTPAERRLADTVLHFPGDLAGYSASELARMTEVSNAAVSRFVRRLGFASYEEMRRVARQEREAGSPVYLAGSESRRHPVPMAGHVEQAVANLQATFTPDAQGTVGAIADAAAAARAVWTVGFRHCRALADYLRWSLGHARAGVRVFPGPGETLGETAVEVGTGDLVVLFALRRRVPAVPRLIDVCLAQGAHVAVVTDPGMVDTRDATFVLRTSSAAPGRTDDHVGAFVFCRLLTEAVMARLGEGAVERLSQIDDLHGDLGDL